MTASLQSEPLLDPGQVVIRPLTATDSAAYRRLRQRVLEIGEGRFFSTSYTRDQELTSEDQWRDRCAETSERCTIGIFVDAELVGIMGILPYGDPRNRTTEWESTWIDPRYRKAGVAKSAYEQVRAWSHDHGYRYAVLDIRADNLRSRAIREKQGAMYLCTKRDLAWADGSTADAHFFMLDLSPAAERARSVEQAVGLLEAALAFLKQEQHHDMADRAGFAHGRGACA